VVRLAHSDCIVTFQVILFQPQKTLFFGDLLLSVGAMNNGNLQN
jgi:hypothetical protein